MGGEKGREKVALTTRLGDDRRHNESLWERLEYHPERSVDEKRGCCCRIGIYMADTVIAPTSASAAYIERDNRFGAANYAPLDVVITRGSGAFVWDVDGNRFVDMLSAYSAVNQGHCHPRLVNVVKEQVEKLTLTSRAFHNDKLGFMLEKISALTGFACVLPMNTGAEGVETAIKCIRRYGYRHRKIAPDAAEIIVASENFHGRTTTIVGFSTDPDARGDYGPFAPGFKIVPYGDAQALEAAITPQTAGVLLEPIQGEAGVKIPPASYLPAVREICTRHGMLLCLDEIQTGLGRTGKMCCFEHTGIRPDILILGKALGGGMYPVSCIATSAEIMSVFTPGSHGSTFGGSPMAAAIACEALDILVDEKLAERAADLGAHMLGRLSAELRHPKLKEVRGMGLLLAIEFTEPLAKSFVKKLKAVGVLAKDTHYTTIRFAPPLVIEMPDLDEAISHIVETINADADASNHG